MGHEADNNTERYKMAELTVDWLHSGYLTNCGANNLHIAELSVAEEHNC